MKEIFTRSSYNPVLRPSKEWRKIYNPGAALDAEGHVHLFPRVVKEKKTEDWHSRIGHAVSADGEHFEWLEPALVRSGDPHELRGFEDPRLTYIDGLCHMVYAQYDGETPELHSVSSPTLAGPWQKHESMVPEFKFFESGGRIVRFENGTPVEKNESKRGDHWSKSGALFPERIRSEYVLMFGEFYIWLATSKDGESFAVRQPMFLGPRKGTNFFDNTFVEMGPPPIKTDKGWLVLYHGVNEKFVYQIGFLLLDLEDPSKVLYRSDEPIFGPKEDYELVSEDIDVRGDGVTPQVTFCCGTVVRGDMLWIYYGAGDSSICTAWAPIAAILELVP